MNARGKDWTDFERVQLQRRLDELAAEGYGSLTVADLEFMEDETDDAA
jgi:hypothetical protein